MHDCCWGTYNIIVLHHLGQHHAFCGCVRKSDTRRGGQKGSEHHNTQLPNTTTLLSHIVNMLHEQAKPPPPVSLVCITQISSPQCAMRSKNRTQQVLSTLRSTPLHSNAPARVCFIREENARVSVCRRRLVRIWRSGSTGHKCERASLLCREPWLPTHKRKTHRNAYAIHMCLQHASTQNERVTYYRDRSQATQRNKPRVEWAENLLVQGDNIDSPRLAIPLLSQRLLQSLQRFYTALAVIIVTL